MTVWHIAGVGYTTGSTNQGHLVFMGLIRLLIVLALVYTAWVLWRRWQAAQTSRRNSAPPPRAPRMVRCAQCQLHLPENLALRQDDKWYCCSEHRDVEQRH